MVRIILFLLLPLMLFGQKIKYKDLTPALKDSLMTPGTLKDDYLNYVDVKWFGVEADGSTNDYTNLLSAINYASENRKALYFGNTKDTIVINSRIYLDSLEYIYFFGDNPVIKAGKNLSSGMIAFYDCNRPVVKNITFTGGDYTSSMGLFIVGTAGVGTVQPQVLNCRFTNLQYGIYAYRIAGFWGGLISENMIDSCTFGIYLNDDAEYLNISDNTIVYNDSIGIYTYSGNTNLADNYVNNNGIGIYVDGHGSNGDHCSIIGGSVNHSDLAGIVIDSVARGLTITNVMVYATNTNAPHWSETGYSPGIAIRKSQSVTIENSQIKGNSVGVLFYADTSWGCSIINNQFAGNTSGQIREDTTTVYNRYINNQFQTSAYRPVAYDGDDVTLHSTSIGTQNYNIGDYAPDVADVEHYGAIPNDGLDDYDAIYAAINSGKRHIKIGRAITDSFIVRSPILPLSNQTIEVNGYVKAIDATIEALAVDVSATSDTVIVEDGSGYSVGQWIAISDTMQDLQGGTTNLHDRRVADCTTIASISGDTLFLDVGLEHSFAVADLCSVATMGSVMLLENVENVTICGTGKLDQNKANGYDVESVVPNGQEEVRAACALTLNNSERITVRDITVENAILHSLQMKYCDSVLVDNVNISYAHDKNILSWYSHHVRIQNCNITFADYEDGFNVYYMNDDIKIMNNLFAFNGRYGLYVGSSNTKIFTLNNTFRDNGISILLNNADKISSINDYIIYGGKYRKLAGYRYAVQIVNSSFCDFTNLKIEKQDSSTANIGIVGDSHDIKFLGGFSRSGLMSASNGRGLLLGAASGNYPEDVTFINFLFDSNKIAIDIDSGTVNLRINNCIFKNNTSAFSGAQFGEIIFNQCDGFTYKTEGLDTIFSGQSYVNVSHGIEYTTPDIRDVTLQLLTPLNGATSFYQHLMTGSTFRITCDSTVTDTTVFFWKCDVSQVRTD